MKPLDYLAEVKARVAAVYAHARVYEYQLNSETQRRSERSLLDDDGMDPPYAALYSHAPLDIPRLLEIIEAQREALEEAEHDEDCHYDVDHEARLKKCTCYKAEADRKIEEILER